ncbi:MAG: BrnT family toxin [Rugosibacter sp.]
MKFEWDNKKAESNLKKHQVSFEEGASIFGDTLALSFRDPDHSVGEIRYLTFGASQNGILLVLSHTYRNNLVRIISVRRATRAERKIYEK